MEQRMERLLAKKDIMGSCEDKEGMKPKDSQCQKPLPGND
jgi:hypothetical protein